MKLTIIASLLLIAALACSPVFAEDAPAPTPGRNGTIEYVGAGGRSLGSVTTIGGTTYYIGPDGATLATSTVVDGRKVFKSY